MAGLSRLQKIKEKGLLSLIDSFQYYNDCFYYFKT